MSDQPPAPIRAEITVALDAATAFETFVDELVTALGRRGIRFEPEPHGRVTQCEVEIGRVRSWQPGERIAMDWRPASWEPGHRTTVRLRLEPAGTRTRIVLEHMDFDPLLDGDAAELTGWFAGEVAGHLFEATTPAAFGDWLTDRRARRPSGRQSQDVYRDPLYHRPNFRLLLDILALTADDRLLEVGCGGGAFLHDALESGCRAQAIDHSEEMVRTARELNREAIEEGRLEIVQGSADRLPFADESFTAAVCTGVLGFIPDPVGALAEIRRVLVDGGRLALFTGGPQLRGTPAAPEPIASRINFYEDDELERIARDAGFAEIEVTRPDEAGYAREAGVPEEHIALFEGRGGQLLVAER